MSAKDEIPPPKNRRHQAVADAWLAGKSHREAYLAAGYKPASAKTAEGSAARILARADVKAYCRAIQQRVIAEESVLSHLEMRQFLARVVRTPFGSLDISDENTGTLILSESLSESEKGSSRSLRKVDPLKAIELDLKLSGEDRGANAMEQLATALSQIGARDSLPAAPL